MTELKEICTVRGTQIHGRAHSKDSRVMCSAAVSSAMVLKMLLDPASSQVHGTLGPSVVSGGAKLAEQALHPLRRRWVQAFCRPSIISDGDGTPTWESCALNKASA